jgi:enoyl-[acyl-carrier protein] reductase III
LNSNAKPLEAELMNEALAGKTALVTGGARGIGRATALKLARAGCDVVIVYHTSQDEAEAVCSEIGALGRRTFAFQADVGEPESVGQTFTAIRERFDRLDIVVSNAATGVLRPALQLTLKHWRRCMETNALALTLLAQQAVPLMSRGGRIVGLSSLGASRAIPLYAFVGASKAALESIPTP